MDALQSFKRRNSSALQSRDLSGRADSQSSHVSKKKEFVCFDNKTVLLVDNNGQDVQTMGKVLTELQVRFLVADNLREFEEVFNKTLQDSHKFDGIFVKLIMPGANGFDVAQRIRELERNYGMSL